jgi:enediyne biosynthesis protein E4
MLTKDPVSQSGTTNWERPAKRFILETAGSGVALLDYDNDGWLEEQRYFHT